MSIKVVMVTGSYPPEPCGVGGYTFKLVEALKTRHLNVQVFTGHQFSLSNSFANLSREIRDVKADLIHIQYPTAGYGAGLGPQALSMLLSPCVVTLHEVSQVHPLRRLSLYPFSLRARALVFTNEYEKAYAARFAPWIKGRSRVIPIGSAIPGLAPGAQKDGDDIVYFGLIRPKKGIEEVLELARQLKARHLPYRVRVIGLVEERFGEYLRQLQAAAADLPVAWSLGLPEPEAGALLARAKVAYMPFPDGASERRSSLLALLANEVATVTTQGIFTPDEMNGVVAYAATPERALPIVGELLSNAVKREQLAAGARKYMRRREWGEIARAHNDLYRSIVRVAPRGRHDD